MKALILIWSLLLPYMAFGQATSSDTQYRNDGETLINGSFEQGKKGYTLSVGSGSLVWSTQSATSLNGKAMQLTLSAQTFSFKSATTQGSKLTGQNGYIEVYLSANNSGAEICPLVDGVSAPTTTPNECQPIIAGVGFKPYGIQKVFGASSLNYEIRGVSNASYTGVIYADDGSVAKKSIVTQSSGAKLVGTITITGCANAWSTTSTSYVDFATQTGCTYTASGSAQSPSTNIPAIKFPSLQAGDYRLEYEGGVYQAASGTDQFLQFWDGANTARESSHFFGSSTGFIVSGISQSISYSSPQNNITLSIRGKVTGGGNIQVYGTTASPAVIKVWHFPPQPISTINTSNGWLIDVNIGGANPSYTAVRSSYTEMSGSSWDMVINTSKGSAAAEIPCQTTTASTGLTCSGVDESLGVVFTPPKTGKYRVCVFGAVSLGSGGNGIFQLIETPNNAQTILQEGGSRINIQSATASLEQHISHCSNFTFNDTAKKTIRLMHEKSNGVSIIPITDRDANSGQRDFHFTVEPIVENIQASLQGYNSTDGAINPEIFSVSYGTTNLSTVCSASPCSYLDQIGNYAVSVTRAMAADYTLNLNKTFSKLKCSFNGQDSGNFTAGFGNSTYASCTNCNSLRFITIRSSAGTAVDSLGTLFCHGVK